MNPGRTTLIVVSILGAVMLMGCAKEQPATKETAKETAQTPMQQSGPAQPGDVCDTLAATVPAEPALHQGPAATVAKRLPKLVDLGRGTCIPCKQMAPILKELTEDYRGRAVVEVIDLREKPEAAQEYKIRVIPTQVFFDKNGSEVWRHEGYLPKDQIVAKFQELGVRPK